MKLGEFINKFSHNNIVRLQYKISGGYKCALETDNDVSMDWEIIKGVGKNRHYVDNEVISIVSIYYRSGHYPEAINIVIEELENQPFLEEIIEKKNNTESSP